jgi:hypothetical protein
MPCLLGFACVVLLVLPADLKLAAVVWSPERQLPIAEDSGPYCQGLLLLCRKLQVPV